MIHYGKFLLQFIASSHTCTYICIDAFLSHPLSHPLYGQIKQRDKNHIKKNMYADQ